MGNYNYKTALQSRCLIIDYQKSTRIPFSVSKKLRVCRQGVNFLFTNS
ncbi:hypothetical protein BACCELL_03554 [Bacteroides cellulosilyticus DSM 14838]|uniref:Uncharacterized protein n=1 Tax=Bacteroides cellulosilyticus DSM 14838 TaxID=537012 RepID=E2NGX9_9BACE|nr:hypothetical protein BACCELL_03554 [Bacteroides cellulosilyticus DSM 14838]